jgi:RNA polymerase sporulation-specific sigma factor
MIGEKSEDAYYLMINKYIPIIKNAADLCIKKYPSYNMDKEELIQEGIIGLINAINSFTENKNCIFYTYALVLIKREMYKHITRCSRGKNLILTLSKSMQETLCDDELFFEDTLYCKKDLVEEEVLAKYYEEIIYNFKYELDGKASSIYELKMNNFNTREISILLELSYKSVDNSWRIIKKKLVNYIQEKI